MPLKDEGSFWNIFSYLIAGPVVWGTVGRAVDEFTSQSAFTYLGIFAGLIFSIYLIWLRFVRGK